jgi:hypothetical protein
MKNRNPLYSSMNMLSLVIILLQLFDILIHLLTNQFELIRVQANIIILLWVFYINIKTNSASLKLITTLTISIYLILNFLFIFEYGIINPYDNSIRIVLMILIVSTSILVFLRYIQINLGVKENYEK